MICNQLSTPPWNSCRSIRGFQMRMTPHFTGAYWLKLTLWLLSAMVLAHTAFAQESKPAAQKPPAASKPAPEPRAPAVLIPAKEEPDDAARRTA